MFSRNSYVFSHSHGTYERSVTQRVIYSSEEFSFSPQLKFRMKLSCIELLQSLFVLSCKVGDPNQPG